MAEGNEFWSFELSEEEIAFAVTLAQPLKEENVDKFLEIYDSIPAKVEIERVSVRNFVSVLQQQSSRC